MSMTYASSPTRSEGWIQRLNSEGHHIALWLYMVIVFGHWVEHLAQVYQVYIMGWQAAEAGGALGLVAPGLAQSEFLHTGYNTFLLAGIILLRPGFVGRGRFWWNVALLVQGWHFFEHLLLQIQWLSGIYLFGAQQQTSIFQLWFPRVELHFVYNLLVFLPMVIGMFYHHYPPSGDRSLQQCLCGQTADVKKVLIRR